MNYIEFAQQMQKRVTKYRKATVKARPKASAQAVRSLYLHWLRHFDVGASKFHGLAVSSYTTCLRLQKETTGQIAEIEAEQQAIYTVSRQEGLLCPIFGPDGARYCGNADLLSYLSLVQTTLRKFKTRAQNHWVQEWTKLPGHLPLELRSHIATYLTPPPTE
jgi:hypothetical protein